MKRLIFISVILLLVVPAFAGDRFDGLNYGNSLEGVILDRQINGLDPLRNPANLIYSTKLMLAIDAPSMDINPFTGQIYSNPIKFNLALPMASGMVLGFTANYGNNSTWQTWQATNPSWGSLDYNGWTGSDSNTTKIETGLTTTTNDDWTKKEIYSGTQNTIQTQGGRIDLLGGFGMKISDNLSFGAKVGIETNNDGKIKQNSTYSYNVSEVVPLNLKTLSADESFSGTKTVSSEQQIATDPTAIKVIGGVLLKVGDGLELDVSAFGRLKTGDVSEISNATETTDLNPDGDTKASINDWIGNLSGLLYDTGRTSASESIARNYKGSVSGMDLGSTAILRMKMNPTTTLVFPVSFSSNPYSYSQSRTDTTVATAVSTAALGGVSNTSIANQTTSYTYDCNCSSSTVGIGAGLNYKSDSYNIGIGVKVVVGGSETTENMGPSKVVTSGTNTNIAATGFTIVKQTTDNYTPNIKTVTKVNNTVIYLPIGMEGNITDRLMFRAGITPAWTMISQGQTVTTTTTPVTTTTTVNSGVPVVASTTQTQTSVTNTLPGNSSVQLIAYSNIGLGYKFTDNLLVDISALAGAGWATKLTASAILTF